MNKRKAIIFAAGLGTRLKPLTDSYPKALVILNGKPLLWHSINFLKRWGINEVVVNVHHFADSIIDYLAKEGFGIPIHISDERNELLDTGGGLLKARKFLDSSEPFIACNVDVISSVNLMEAIEFQIENNPLATLIVRKRDTNRNFMFDENRVLSGWKNFETGEEISSNEAFSTSKPFAFSGIHVISPRIFNLITEVGKFSITIPYLRLAQQNKIMGYLDKSDFWLDLGKPGQITIAEEFLSNQSS
jgi:NDP-sugar pyrophosphorylase family protein